MKFRNARSKKILLNITPLIDALFILIIFFTVSSSFLEKPAIKLDLPESLTAEFEKVEKVVLDITKTSRFYVGNIEYTLKTLPGILRERLASASDKNLVINADKEVKHGLIVRIMDIARQSGAERLTLMTAPSTSQ